MTKLSVVWMRRNLRIDDNKVIGEAIRNSDKILPIFVFDTTILKRFSNPRDRRLSFIANILFNLNEAFGKYNGELTVLHGDPVTLVPKFAKFVDAETVYVDEDFEPLNIERDEKVKEKLNKQDQDFESFVDHLLVRPDVILKSDGTPFKKFTPYMRVYKDYLADNADDLMARYTYKLNNKLYDEDLSKSGIKMIDISKSPSDILDQIGYEYVEDELWHPNKAHKALNNFIQHKIKDYKVNRDIMGIDGTSRLSPYIRHGVLSVRELLYQAWPHRKSAGGDQWINELIWREFYVSIMYHFPDSTEEEFQEKYRGKLEWVTDENMFRKFCQGKTGFPIVDAAIRQLLEEGWMHNRCRMIVASFLTKNLFIDWRRGEEFFAQHLMDYDLSSNSQGWQWSCSTGVDSQPYFRIFSPESQQSRFDPDGVYIKRYVEELENATPKQLLSPDLHVRFPKYPAPIVDYKETREQAIEYFKNIK